MANHQFKAKGKKGLFDEENTISNLSAKGNILERISMVIDFEKFRPMPEPNLLNTKNKSNAGAKPFKVVLMFKIMIL